MGNTLPVSATLDQPQPRYYPGEVLSGKMTLNIGDPFQYSQLRVRVSADIYTQWYQQSGDRHNTGRMIYVHALAPQILDMSLNLTSAPGVLQKGVHEFPFRLQLPADALPSGLIGWGTTWGGLVYIIQPQVMLPGSQTWEPEIDSNCSYRCKYSYPDNCIASACRPSFHILGAAHPGHLATPVPVRSNQDSNRTACCCCMCCCDSGTTQDVFEELVSPDACCSCCMCVSEKGGFRLNVASDKSVLILDHGETFTLTMDIDATGMDIDFVEVAFCVRAETKMPNMGGWGAIPDPSDSTKKIFIRLNDIHSEQVPDSEVKKGSRRQLQYTFTVPAQTQDLPDDEEDRETDAYCVAPCSAENPIISFKYSISVRPSVGGCCTIAQSTLLPMKLVAHVVQQQQPQQQIVAPAPGGGGHNFMPPSENPPPPAFGAMFGATN